MIGRACRVPTPCAGWLRFRTAGLCFGLSACVTVGAVAAEFYVDQGRTNAADSNVGSALRPWRTIQKASSTMKAGDVTYVRPGIYEEMVQSRSSGVEGGFVTFKGEKGTVVRGFQVFSNDFVRIVGFEIWQTSSNHYAAGIELRSVSGVQILDNYVHNTYGAGISLPEKYPSHNVVIRGNRVSWAGTTTNGPQIGDCGIFVAGDHLVAEYNDISHVADFFNFFGQSNVLRNNFLHDTYFSDFPGYTNQPEGYHTDGFQYFSDLLVTSRNVVENNLVLSNTLSNGHGIILRNTSHDPSTELIFRGNLLAWVGEELALLNPFTYFRAYNNTAVQIGYYYSPKGRYCMSSSNGSTGTKVINNVFYDCAVAGGMLYYRDATSTNGFYADYNLAYLSGSPSDINFIGQDPQFVAYALQDFHLRSNSPAVESAGPITTTRTSGGGSVVPVADAGYFTDGWGIVEGDSVRIGTNGAVTLVGVDYADNQLTVSGSVTWLQGDSVTTDYPGAKPCRGAFAYREAGFGYGVSLQGVKQTVTVSPGRAVQLQALVSNPDCVRFVVFCVNGLPVAQIVRSPFAWTWVPSGPGVFNIEARAYPRFPDVNLSSSSFVSVSSATSPGKPANLRISPP